MRVPQVMGVVNVTPDSFSDGGRDVAAAIAHARALVEQGAQLLDIGGESTRPGALEVSIEEELRRVIPVIEALRGAGVQLSIDTRKAEVARAAIEAGAQLVNDVSGLRDEAMIDVVAQTGVIACVMHMRGTPETMQNDTRYSDVVSEVIASLGASIDRAVRRGVRREQLWVDPGVGFGKDLEGNLALIRRAHELRVLGLPVVFGVSRKAFLGALTGRSLPADRDVASAMVAGLLTADEAVDVLRVHDVKATRDAIAVAVALRGA